MKLQDFAFVSPQNAATERQKLVNQYVAAFRDVEVAAYDRPKSSLKGLAANISAWVVTSQQSALSTLVDGHISKLS